MATIKDVASLAGVSVGTVSNVLNGKTSNQELIEKVEKAIKQLDYRPDASARSLKNTKNNIIGIIMPNLIRPDFVRLLSDIEKEASNNGYHVLFKVCQNNRILEKKYIDQFIMQRVDGIIIINSESQTEPGSVLFKNFLPVIFLDLNIEERPLSNVISIDYSKALEAALKDCVDRGVNEIGIIMERGFMPKETVYEIYGKYCKKVERIEFVDFSQERGFEAAYKLLHDNCGLKMLITSNSLLAKGAKRAAEVLSRNEVEHITFKEENWIEDQSEYIGVIGLSYEKIANFTLKQIINSIEHPKLLEPKHTVIKAAYHRVKHFSENLRYIKSNSKEISLCMVESPAAHALQKLSKVYENETGVSISCNILKYDVLYKKLHQVLMDSDSSIDGFMMDVYWTSSLMETEGLEDLKPYLNHQDNYFAGFMKELLPYYGVSDGHIYGIPFMSGTQLLFYQRDIFEEPSLKAMFKRKYGLELSPPTTWPELNLTAEFFTRSINSKSPVRYGLANVQGANIFTTISFLNRLWAYGGSVFQDGSVAINSNNALAALKSYKKSFQYTSPDPISTTWDQLVENFKSGHYAMVILYDSYAIGISDYTTSKVAGNIGASILPGGTSVLGGWGLGVNKHSQRKEETVRFIDWMCSNHCAVPYSLLGGITLHTNFYKRNDLKHIYPWIALLPESYRLARKREVPGEYLKNNLYIQIYDHIICEELQNILDNKKSEEQALADMEVRINGLLP